MKPYLTCACGQWRYLTSHRPAGHSIDGCDNDPTASPILDRLRLAEAVVEAARLASVEWFELHYPGEGRAGMAGLIRDKLRDALAAYDKGKEE